MKKLTTYPICRTLRLLMICIAVTLASTNIYAQISVTASAGTLGPTAYTTLRAAFAAINAGTHQGVINVSVTGNTTETGVCVINRSGSGAANYTSVLVKPATGVTATIAGNLGTAPNDGLIYLYGANNVTIDGSNAVGGTTQNLTLHNSSLAGDYVIRFGSPSAVFGASNNTIKNCIITMSSTTSDAVVITAGSGTAIFAEAEAANSNNTIQNNNISNAQDGFYTYGPGGMDNGWVITGNNFNTLGFAGITMYDVANTTISGNIISGITINGSTAVSGMLFSYNVSGMNIYANQISNIVQQYNGSNPGAQGIYFDLVTTASNVNVYNNYIANVTGANSNTAAINGHGIYMDLGGGVNIYDNSINQSVNQVGAGGANHATSDICLIPYMPLGGITAGSVIIEDNILVNSETTGNPYAIYSTGANTMFSTIDYNDYVSSANLGFIGGVARATLANMITGFGGNVNSVNITPTWVSSTNLDLTPIAANAALNVGLPIPAITTVDIHGTTRSTVSTTIGAFEQSNNITYTTLANTCTNGDITLSPVTISSGIGIPLVGATIPRIYFKKNAGAWFSNAGTNTGGTATNSTWSFSITAATMGGVTGGDIISYYVIAQTTMGTVFSTPSAGLVATNVNTVTTPPTTPNTYTVEFISLTGLYTTASVCYNATTAQTVTYGYTSSTGTPNQYTLTWTPAGPTPVTTYAPLGNPISVTVPAGTAANTYTGTLTMQNSTTLCTNTSAYTITLTVNPSPAVISGTFSECQGSSTILTDATASGTWSSSTTTVGTVGSTSGSVYGAGAGTTTITYASGTGCYSTATFTVIPNPSAIMGTPAIVCQGSSINLSDPVTGGNWSTVAGSGSVSVVGGTVTGLTSAGLTPGTATVSYSFGGGACAVSTIVTINPVSAISPTGPTVCTGLSTTLSDAIAGGTWTSGSTSIATIGSSNGIVAGLTPGTSTIQYTFTTGCTTSTVLTVNLSPVAISGTTTLCFGNTTTYLDGTPGGTWSSSNTSIATIGSTSGTATAVSTTGGTTTIAYTMPLTGCSATTVLTVNPVPAPIQGNMTVCTGLTTLLTDPTSGGGWLSGSTAIATIGSSSGIVFGQSNGTSIITYTIPTTGCTALAIVTVNSSPVAIEGNFSMCVGYPTQLSDPSGTGTWTSTNTTVGTVGVTTGIVSPQASGTTTISYILASGCNAAATITVNPVPAPISGTLNSCAGYFTPLSDASGGGNWTSLNTSVATINSSTGLVYAVATGTSTIEYAFTATGCYASTVFTVNPSPVAISGTPDICQGLTATFNDPTPGGNWSSSNTNATVGSASGIVTGAHPGTATIIYTLGTSCFVTYPVTITTPPTPINGPTSVCHNYAITLTDGTTPGTWNVTPGSGTAAISTSGVLTGGNTGVVIVSYTTLACNPVTQAILVNPLPAPITGVGNLCVGSGTSLTDATLGGTWSSSNSTATVSSTGVVSGVDTGSGTYISYTLPTGCYVVAPVVVFPIPAPIQGVDSVCPGSYVVLSDITPGGAWSSSNGTIAYSIAFTGRVEGVVAGNVNISYTLISGCYVTMPFLVENPLPASLTVTQSIDSPSCAGQTDVLTAVPVNGGTPTFEWENWGSYIGNTNPYPFVPTHGDYITCIMTTHDICASPAVVQTSVVLNIYPVVAPQVVITTSSARDTASYLGEVFTFYSDVTYGGVNPAYQWGINGAPVSGATNSTFTTHIYEINELISCTVTGTSPCDTPTNTNVGVGSIEIYGLNYLSAGSLTAGGNDLSLFPNPNTGSFTLSGTISSNSGKDVTLEVTDMLGRTIYTGKTAPQSGTLKTDIKLDNEIAAGTYLLRVYTESGIQTFHFVIGK